MSVIVLLSSLILKPHARRGWVVKARGRRAPRAHFESGDARIQGNPKPEALNPNATLTPNSLLQT